MRDSNLSVLCSSDNMAISLKICQKQKSRLQVHDTPILEVICVTLTENSSVVTNDTQWPRKYPHQWKYLLGHTSIHNMALRLSQYFYLLMETSRDHYFQVRSPYCQVAQRNQKTPIPVFSRWQVRSEKAKKRMSINTNHSYQQRSTS